MTGDHLITDIRLAGYNGLAVLIRTGPKVPAIVITRFSDPLLEDQARRLGAAYLLKPVNARRLVEPVQERLSDWNTVFGRQRHDD